jgi:glutathione peroxidase-family protein
MTVTNLIKNIGRCRDLLASKDFKAIKNNIYIFEKTYEEAKRNIDKYTKNGEHTLDFTCDDLKELSDEIFAYVKNFQTRFTYDKSLKMLTKYESIGNDEINEFVKEQCDYMYVDTRLREAYKIFAYLGVITWIFAEFYKSKELDAQLLSLIRSYLK